MFRVMRWRDDSSLRTDITRIHLRVGGGVGQSSMHYNVNIECHDFGALNLCCTRPTYREIVIASNRPRGLLRCGHPSFLPVCCVHSPPLPTKRGPFCPIYCRPFGRLAGRLPPSLAPSASRNAPPASPIKALATRAADKYKAGGCPSAL